MYKHSSKIQCVTSVCTLVYSLRKLGEIASDDAEVTQARVPRAFPYLYQCNDSGHSDQGDVIIDITGLILELNFSISRKPLLKALIRTGMNGCLHCFHLWTKSRLISIARERDKLSKILKKVNRKIDITLYNTSWKYI